MQGSFNEEARSLIEQLKKADKNFQKSLRKEEREPDSDIAYEIEQEKGTHATMGRDKSSREDFQKVRFGREWPQESWFQHKGLAKWHPEDITTPGVQKPAKGRGKEFYPEIDERQPQVKPSHKN
jgi:hypothetical protein